MSAILDLHLPPMLVRLLQAHRMFEVGLLVWEDAKRSNDDQALTEYPKYTRARQRRNCMPQPDEEWRWEVDQYHRLDPAMRKQFDSDTEQIVAK